MVSTLTYQSGVYENDHLGVVDSAETMKSAANIDFSFSDIYKPFEPAKVYYGGRQRFKAIQVPFAVECTRIDRNKRAYPRLSAKRHRLANSTPNDAVGVQAQYPAEHTPNEAVWVQAEELAENMPIEVVEVQAEGPAENMPFETVEVQAEGPAENMPFETVEVQVEVLMPNEAVGVQAEGLANNMPNEAVGFQAQGVDVSLEQK